MTYHPHTHIGYINNANENYPALAGINPRETAKRLLDLSAQIGGEIIIPSDAPGRLSLNYWLDVLAGVR